MRFEVSKVLDAIERRLTTDPALARGVVDLAEVVRYADLDGGRPASLLRLGLVVDALATQLAEDNAAVYAVVHRGLLSDADLTSNERMVVRRWADDGLVEVLPSVGDRVLEVADLLGLPVLSRLRFEGVRERYGWLAGQAGRLMAPVPGKTGATLVAQVGGGNVPATANPDPVGAKVLARLWRCPEPGCANFGGGGGAFSDLAPARRAGGQPPPTLHTGAPACPRHGTVLTDIGERPPAEALAVRVNGIVRQRFVVADGDPVTVGRAPEQGGIMLGQWLSEEARRWISRSHVRFEMRGTDVVAQDVSTNGTGVRPGGSMDDAERMTIKRQSRVLAPGDLIELYPGVHVGRARTLTSSAPLTPVSVMADAPTLSMRIVDRQ
ncbi:FHA domain-containing protein [Phytohabitans rumicis]|uniref:FHA domain-containing protein n=1 Tax=Phytohabitans rumicis TaxID=1076125 RepID=UPI001567AA2F|nr:FHA domain-containing protein [Phytohabitans rumicis]